MRNDFTRTIIKHFKCQTRIVKRTIEEHNTRFFLLKDDAKREKRETISKGQQIGE